MNQTIVILGDPVAKGRPRFSRFGHVYTPTKTRNAEAYIKEQARAQWTLPMLEGPVRLEVAFAMPRPKSMPKKVPWEFHVKKPDMDNMEKLVKDALNKVCWKDDSQVCQKTTRKFYDVSPKLVITITAL